MSCPTARASTTAKKAQEKTIADFRRLDSYDPDPCGDYEYREVDEEARYYDRETGLDCTEEVYDDHEDFLYDRWAEEFANTEPANA